VKTAVRFLTEVLDEALPNLDARAGVAAHI
jgi:hypothetical protein